MASSPGRAPSIRRNECSRHVAVLKDAFDTGLVALPKRLGVVRIKPRFYSLVLVSSNARITRPSKRAAAAIDGLDTVIKVDQFEATLDRAYDERSLAALGKVVSSDTVASVARSLAGLHSPMTFDWAGKFGLVTQPTSAVPSKAPSSTSARSTCESCGRGVSAAVVAFCHERPERFGTRVCCMTCQRRFKAPKD